MHALIINISIFSFMLKLKIEASDIYEVPLTKKHDTLYNYEFSPWSTNYVPPSPSLSNSVPTSRPVAYQVFID